MMVPTLNLDATATLGQMNEGVVRELNRLEPFGVGNRAPLFCVPGVTVAGPPRVVGKDSRHLQLTIKQGTSLMKCIAFGHAEATSWLKSGSPDRPGRRADGEQYMGRKSVEFKVKDLRAAVDAGDASPTRAVAERLPVGE